VVVLVIYLSELTILNDIICMVVLALLHQSPTHISFFEEMTCCVWSLE
jgi:hypothetical protein